jgi:Rieske Fe-S protein
VDRRNFLVAFIKTTLGVLGLGCLTSTVFLFPPEIIQRPLNFFPVLERYKRPKRGVKRVTITYNRSGREMTTRAYLVAGKGDEVRALSPICTHLGCMVRWDRIEKEFHCPCHGGKYDIHGNVIAGPPPAPLTEMPVKIIDDYIAIGLRV